MNILQATQDPQLFDRWFKDRGTWAAWFAFLCALFALPMSGEQEATYRRCTERAELPKERFNEAWLVCGRRAGKSFVLALIAVFLACFFNWRPYLSPGESGFIVIVAADRRQAETGQLQRWDLGSMGHSFRRSNTGALPCCSLFRRCRRVRHLCFTGNDVTRC